ncbi:MAG: DNA-binding domain-containing protein [Sandaracinus sp.]
MSDVDELLQAFQRVCLGERPDAADLARLEHGEGSGPAGRFGLYRELVRSRLRDLVATAYPRTTRALGREAMDRLADRHVTEVPLATRFFREHAESFGAWAAEVLRETPMGPPWSLDLLRLEAAQWPTNYRPTPRPARCVDFDLELVPVPSPALRLLDTEWNVHVSGEDEPTRGHFHLAIYRRPDHRVETRWMEPMWASLLADLSRAERPAIDSVRVVLGAHGRVADAAFVDELTTFLALLVDNGALLGSVPDAE